MNARKTRCLAFAYVLLCATIVFADPPTEPGLANLYSLDDGSGNTAVDSVGGNSATLHNWGSGSKEWITGMFGGALDFNNSSQYAITNSPISATSGNQFSVSFWMRSDVHNPTSSVLLTPQGDNWIGINSGVSIKSLHDTNSPLTGVWESYSITVDRTAQTASIYRDGALRATGSISLPTLNAPWVIGHNQDLANSNGSYQGALDNVQFYGRTLSTNEIQALASQPPQPGLAAHLVAPAQNYGSVGTGQYATASTSFFVDVAHTDWIAWNRFPELRSVSDSLPGKLLGTQTPEVDDYFNLTVTNPLGQHMTVSMDQNGGLGAPIGQQSVVFGTTANAPVVVRGDNLGSPSFFNESGAFNSLFSVSGTYTFSLSFQNIGGLASYPDVYLLAHTVPEPSTLVLGFAGYAGLGFVTLRKKLRRA
jgi:hypothetical protein